MIYRVRKTYWDPHTPLNIPPKNFTISYYPSKLPEVEASTARPQVMNIKIHGELKRILFKLPCL